MLPFAAAPVVLLVATAGAAAGQPATREEVLASIYPGATIRAEQVFLTPAQQTSAAARAGTDVPSRLIARYVATRDGQTVGRAYVDTHTVRTKKETLLVMLDAQGRIARVEATAFQEPAEFKAPDAWLRQYRARQLDGDLRLGAAIRPIAGATLTARATTSAVRRALAIDELLQEAQEGRK